MIISVTAMARDSNSTVVPGATELVAGAERGDRHGAHARGLAEPGIGRAGPYGAGAAFAPGAACSGGRVLPGESALRLERGAVGELGFPGHFSAAVGPAGGSVLRWRFA